jgi:hypothetical protein
MNPRWWRIYAVTPLTTVDLGAIPAETMISALDQYSRHAGYESYADACAKTQGRAAAWNAEDLY